VTQTARAAAESDAGRAFIECPDVNQSNNGRLRFRFTFGVEPITGEPEKRAGRDRHHRGRPDLVQPVAGVEGHVDGHLRRPNRTP
jgi:hypothetical protein